MGPSKKLTEREAWLKLEAIWNDVVLVSKYEYPNVHVCGKYVVGLCSCVIELRAAELIDDATMYRMQDKIRKHRILLQAPSYIWPLDHEGAKARASFCKLQTQTWGQWLKNRIKGVLHWWNY